MLFGCKYQYVKLWFFSSLNSSGFAFVDHVILLQYWNWKISTKDFKIVGTCKLLIWTPFMDVWLYAQVMHSVRMVQYSLIKQFYNNFEKWTLLITKLVLSKIALWFTICSIWTTTTPLPIFGISVSRHLCSSYYLPPIKWCCIWNSLISLPPSMDGVTLTDYS